MTTTDIQFKTNTEIQTTIQPQERNHNFTLKKSG
jgi:hypothetical protein